MLAVCTLRTEASDITIVSEMENIANAGGLRGGCLAAVLS
jgi:hypothetical protein